MTKKVEDEDELLDEFALILVKKLKEELDIQDKVFKGSAQDSIDYFPEDKTVGSKLDYVYNIEYGRKAGTYVPIQPLVNWVMHKMNISDEKHARQIAYVINKNIHDDGIPMTRFAKITLEKLERK